MNASLGKWCARGWLPALVLCGSLASTAPRAAPAPRAHLAVAWNGRTLGTGSAAPMQVRPEYAFLRPPLEAGANTTLHYTGGKLYLLNRTTDRVQVLDPTRWTVLREYPLGTDVQ